MSIIPPPDANEIEDLCSSHKYRTEIPNIVAHLKLDPWAFKAYFIMKMTAGDKGRCFKSNSRMAEEIGCSIPTLIKLKHQLVEEGLIIVTKRKHPSGGDAPDLIQIRDIWPQNIEYMSKLYPKNPENDFWHLKEGGGKRDLVGGVNAVNGGGKRRLHKEDLKEEDLKEQQQHSDARAQEKIAAAVFSAKKEETSEVYPCLKDLEIPETDKREITKHYSLEVVEHALRWVKHPETKIKKSAAAAIKWACQNKPEIPKAKVEKRDPFDPSGFNQHYYRGCMSVSKWEKEAFSSLNLRNVEDKYLQTPHEKIYFKDAGFLDQLESFFYKYLPHTSRVFGWIKGYKQEFSNHLVKYA